MCPLSRTNWFFLEIENLEIKEKLIILSEKFGNDKGEASSMKMELEGSLKTVEKNLAIALERTN